MKAFLNKILPWHIRRSLASTRRFYAMRKPPFEGVYSEFGEMKLQASTWHSRKWAEMCRLWAEKGKRQIGFFLPKNPLFSKALLPVTVAMLTATGRRNLRILDYGGAAGVDYANLLASLGNPKTAIRYHVVDTPECCEAGRKVWAADPGISFASRLPEPPEQFDIVYASGAIHLVEDFRGLLERFAEYRPALMLFCKTSLHDGPSFVRRQTNVGKGLDNPQWALGIRDVAESLKNFGYALTFRGFSEDQHNVDNYDDDHKVGGTANLLFIRQTDPASPA